MVAKVGKIPRPISIDKNPPPNQRVTLKYAIQFNLDTSTGVSDAKVGREVFRLDEFYQPSVSALQSYRPVGYDEMNSKFHKYSVLNVGYRVIGQPYGPTTAASCLVLRAYPKTDNTIYDLDEAVLSGANEITDTHRAVIAADRYARHVGPFEYSTTSGVVSDFEISGRYDLGKLHGVPWYSPHRVSFFTDTTSDTPANHWYLQLIHYNANNNNVALGLTITLELHYDVICFFPKTIESMD